MYPWNIFLIWLSWSKMYMTELWISHIFYNIIYIYLHSTNLSIFKNRYKISTSKIINRQFKGSTELMYFRFLQEEEEEETITTPIFINRHHSWIEEIFKIPKFLMLPPNLACNKYKLLDLAMAKFMFTDYIKVYAGFRRAKCWKYRCKINKNHFVNKLF